MKELTITAAIGMLAVIVIVLVGGTFTGKVHEKIGDCKTYSTMREGIECGEGYIQQERPQFANGVGTTPFTASQNQQGRTFPPGISYTTRINRQNTRDTKARPGMRPMQPIASQDNVQFDKEKEMRRRGMIWSE